MINNSDKSRDKPSIYIDTCIARDVTAIRNADSIELMTRIKREGWACSISIFGLMELIGIEKEDIFIRRKHYIEKATLDELISARRNLDLKSDEFEKCYQYIQLTAYTAYSNLWITTLLLKYSVWTMMDGVWLQ